MESLIMVAWASLRTPEWEGRISSLWDKEEEAHFTGRSAKFSSIVLGGLRIKRHWQVDKFACEILILVMRVCSLFPRLLARRDDYIELCLHGSIAQLWGERGKS